MAVAGFQAAAASAGIKRPGRLDVGLIYSETPAVAAGVFTTNLVKAAPVLLDRERVATGRAQAILVNSGIANACTGAAGMDLARASAGLAARALAIPEEFVLVSSTGVIGAQLELAKFEGVMPRLVADLSAEGLHQVARAIMTTDTVMKMAHRTGMVNGHAVSFMGMAKGAGMIMPNMATMLCFVVTDANVSHEALTKLLKSGADASFNAITVDGDTSTNDMILALANGRAGNPFVDARNPAGMGELGAILEDLLKDLALQVVADGEGATKLITIRVSGANTIAQADMAARTVANSNLVKTAFFGEDANWGRIVAALGRSGACFDPQRVDVSFDQIMLVRDGLWLGQEAEAAATAVLKQKKITVCIDLKAGSCAAEVHTCDFSIDYVKINADYRS